MNGSMPNCYKNLEFKKQKVSNWKNIEIKPVIHRRNKITDENNQYNIQIEKKTTLMMEVENSNVNK